MAEKRSTLDLVINIILLLTATVGLATAWVSSQKAQAADAKSANLQKTVDSAALRQNGCLSLAGDWRVVGNGPGPQKGTVFQLKQMEGCIVNGHDVEGDSHNVQLVVVGNQARGFVARSEQGDVVGYSVTDITDNSFCVTAEFAKTAGVHNNRQRLTFHKEGAPTNATLCE